MWPLCMDWKMFEMLWLQKTIRLRLQAILLSDKMLESIGDFILIIWYWTKHRSWRMTRARLLNIWEHLRWSGLMPCLAHRLKIISVNFGQFFRSSFRAYYQARKFFWRCRQKQLRAILNPLSWGVRKKKSCRNFLIWLRFLIEMNSQIARKRFI